MEFEREIFRELYEEDGLAVVAKGLGSSRVLVRFLKLYCNIHGVQSQQSVVVLNCSDEEPLLRDCLLAEGVNPKNLPKVVNNETNIQEREAMYSRGGCFIATSRIMIVDLLTNKINPENIAGFLVNHGHRVTETSVETFILRVFRQKNKHGFIKAVTDEPESLLRGFGKVERVLKHLFVQKLYLWPRFHVTIAEALAASKPETIEMMQPLSRNMAGIQQAILVAMDGCMQELRKALPHIDLSDMTLQNGLLKQFDTHIRAQLEPEWHTISFRAKQLVNDLKTLRKLLEYLLRYDAVTFYSFVLSLRVANAQQRNPSPWLSTEAADELFRRSRNRVYLILPEESKEDQEAMGTYKELRNMLGLRASLQLVLEEPSKWGLLTDTLKEVEEAVRQTAATASSLSDESERHLHPARVLVLVKDDRTAQHVRDLIVKDGRTLMHERFVHALAQNNSKLRRQARVARRALVHGKRSYSAAAMKAAEDERALLPTGLTLEEMQRLSIEQQLLVLEETKYRTVHSAEKEMNAGLQRNDSNPKRRKVPGKGGFHGPRDAPDEDRAEDALEASGLLDIEKFEEEMFAGAPSAAAAAPAVGEAEEGRDGAHAHVSFLETDTTKLHTVIYSFGNAHRSLSILEDMRPKYVVLYDPDVEFVRRIEAFQATCPEQIRVYFLVYESSVEEQKYLAALKREKEAFEMLISAKSTMVITPFDLEPHADDQPPPLSLDTRVHPSKKQPKTKRVVVDVREFRSTLPSLLHSAGIQLVPVTLQIGDYVLAPEICVERKSISDLFQSFASGRLYNQVEAMSRHYKIPCLLIEFAPDQPFSLQPLSDITADIKVSSICSKLALLTLHFPQLRLFWSRSPHQTVEIFNSVKAHHPDVDVEKAISAGASEVDGESQVNVAAQEMLMALPGINVHNFRMVLSNVESIAALSRMSEAQLQPLIGPVNAKKLVEYFRATLEQPPSL